MRSPIYRSLVASRQSMWVGHGPDFERLREYQPGDNYAESETDTSDAIFAVSLSDGKILWTAQLTKDDTYNIGCEIPGKGNCPKEAGPDFDIGASPILRAIGGGSIEKARAEADVARRIDPYRGALLRGQIEEHEKQTGAAEAEYSTLVRAYPDSATPFNRLVTLYQNSRQFPEAFRLIDARSSRFPSDESVIYQTGKTAALSGERLDKGETALRQFIAAGKYTLTLRSYSAGSSGFQDALGAALDGTNSGTAGNNFQITFNVSG